MRIEFEGFENDEHRQMAQHCVHVCAGAIPAWCRTLIVAQGWESGEPATIALVSDQSDYLTLRVTLYPKWFVESFERRAYNLRHELIDGTLLPIVNAAVEILTPYVEDKRILDIAVAQMQRRKEQAAESINSMLHKKEMTVDEPARD